MKLLLFGKGGQVGWELQRSLAPLGKVVALDFDSADLHADFAQPERLAETVLAVRPDVVVNAAAHTAVDKAEGEEPVAHLVNAQAPAIIAQAAERLGAWMVHFSTDYVFDGSGTKPWVETDATGPLNAYGRTKLEGEQLVMRNCSKHLVFRCSWIYAARGGNFARTMLRLAAEREQLQVIDDQIGAPTGADLVADVTAHAVRSAAGNESLAGLYHLAAAGETSWYGYASYVLDDARRRGRALRVGSGGLKAVASSAFRTAARRPHNSRLATQRLREQFGLALPPWQQGVERMLAEID